MENGAANYRKSEDVDKRLERIERLQGADPGIFVLAVHAFVEGWIRDSFDYQMSNVSFGSLVEDFIAYCREHPQPGSGKGFASMDALKQSHHETDYVRHRFHGLPRTYAEAATQQLDSFCRLAGIGAPGRMEAIMRYLAAWEIRKPMGALYEENEVIRAQVRRAAEEKRALADQVADLSTRAGTVENLEAALRAKERQLAEVAATSGWRNERIDELRAEKSRVQLELKDARRKLAELDEARDYVDALRRMTAFTRTRAEYERAVVRLTAEQKNVLSQIRLDRDFLVKGSAGTGKTLVLLKAVEKAKGIGTGAASKQDTLDLDELGGSVALLTYTTTMVKYDAFLSSLMSSERFDGADRISTADSFLLERLKAFDPYASIDYSGKTLLELAARYPAAGLEARELAAEAENFIWANDIGMDEYVKQKIERKGMRRPLSASARYEVWLAVETLALEMGSAGTCTRNYAALRLSRAADAGKAPPAPVDYIFVDEAQDLPTIVLKALKASARRCVLLAGDSDQSIYQPGFSWKRSGIDIGGRSRILRSNFRNTVQIHELAERYRSSGSVFDGENTPEAFRDGPVPELFQASDRKELAEALVRRVHLFTTTLGYEPQNIGILVPSNEDIPAIRERLASIGLSLANIRDQDFSFDSTGSVRVSTLHSAKGLDFPVVLLFLDKPPYFGAGYDDESVERMGANIVYVAMTRAMDHLNVFTLEEPGCAAIDRLVDAFKESSGVD
jgi:hypothetical protein